MSLRFITACLRNLLRHKVQNLINIGSLALGLTVFSFAFLYVKQELSYDRGWPEAERVHRFTAERRGLPGVADSVTTSLQAAEWARIMDVFGADFAASTRLVGTMSWVGEGEPQRVGLNLVDAQFVDVFGLHVVEGDIGPVFSAPGFLAINEADAERLGLLGRVGERVEITSFYDDTQKVEFELAAIFRVPQPSSVAFNMLTSMHEYALPLFSQQGGQQRMPWEGSFPFWVKFKEGVDPAALNAQQPAFVEQLSTYDAVLGPGRKVSDHLVYRWQPLTGMHFNPLQFEATSGFAGEYSRVVTFAAIGLLVLLVGCSNSISLSLAAAIERRREIGVRKAAGALPQDILRQQQGESLLIALLALLPALAALELLLPVFQTMLPFTAQIATGPTEYLLLAAIAGAVGLACGAYPAFVLSATRPQAVLRAGAQRDVKGGMQLRTLLVAVQFCLASMLLIGTAALYLQLLVTQSRPVGFNADDILLAIAVDGAPANVMRTELEKIPGVKQVILAGNPPSVGLAPGANTASFVRSVGDAAETKLELNTADFDFVEMMGMSVLAGRDFDRERDYIDTETQSYPDGARPADQRRILINARAARELGFARPEDAVDQVMFWRIPRQDDVLHMAVLIIGVIADNQYVSLRRRPAPEVYIQTGGGDRPGNLMLKYDAAAEGTIRERVTEVAQRLDTRLTGLVFTEDLMNNAFRQERNESRLLLICGGLALMLASFGLYGLAAFTIARQVKEVGVRKVMGAAVASIVSLYLWRFARPIIVASLLAWPVAGYFVLQWMQRFPYQMERAWLALLCIGTLAAVLLLALGTVSVITMRAASVNPVRSLRYE